MPPVRLMLTVMMLVQWIHISRFVCSHDASVRLLIAHVLKPHTVLSPPSLDPSFDGISVAALHLACITSSCMPPTK